MLQGKAFSNREFVQCYGCAGYLGFFMSDLESGMNELMPPPPPPKPRAVALPAAVAETGAPSPLIPLDCANAALDLNSENKLNRTCSDSVVLFSYTGMSRMAHTTLQYSLRSKPNSALGSGICRVVGKGVSGVKPNKKAQGKVRYRFERVFEF